MRARAALIGSLALLCSLSGMAQTAPRPTRIPPSELEDKVLGWMKVYDYKGATVPITLDHRVYSPAQLSIAQLFANWMQASYLPKGALGDVFQIRNPKLSPYNQDTTSLPNAYGALAKLYVQLKYGVNNKIEPLTGDSTNWAMEANGFYGEPIQAISTAQRRYFTLPTFEQQGYGTELDKATDITSHPVLKQFPTIFVRNSVTGNERLIVLTKDHQHPFVKVTKGEYLQAMEAAVLKKYADETQKIARDNKGNQKSIDYFMGYLNGYHAKRLEALKGNREKYKDRLQETAEVATLQPTDLLENYPDLFDGYGGTNKRLTVYTIDPKVTELCKTGGPQWIVMHWTADLRDPISLNLHNSILNNFDFQYVYDYFFDPAKVKGQPYKPLRSPSFTETAVAGKASEATAKTAADPAVVFFEDFSASTVGKKPLNWYSTLDNTGTTSLVTELKGLDGHWTSMAGMEIKPTGLKTPLPRDFDLSYDVVAAETYRWGAKGLYLKLSKTGASPSFLYVKIRPGFDGRPGEIEIEGRFPGAAGYMDGSKWVAAPGFSNNLLNNRVTVTLKKKGDLLQVFVGETKVAEYEKGIPPGLQFDALVFSLAGNAALPDERMFISNVKITAR